MSANERQEESEKSGANSFQVGGDHYRTKIEHWDFVIANDLNYLEGQITKYVCRARKKNGRQDLEKAMHFLVKYLEVYDLIVEPSDQKNLEKDIPSLLVEGRTLLWNVDWQCEGYYGDHTQLYRCRKCRTLVRAANFESAYKVHGACADKSYVCQEGTPGA